MKRRKTKISIGLMLIITGFQSGTLYADEKIIPPDESAVYIQTNGPQDLVQHGDWWSNEQYGNDSHWWNLYIPCQVDDDFTITLEIYDPESFHTGMDLDELEGAGWDSTTFVLLTPDSQTVIAEQVFAPSAETSEKWIPFAEFSKRQFGCGIFKLQIRTGTDDQNGYKLKLVQDDPDGIPGSGDELNLAPVKTTFQHIGAGCALYWFYIPPEEQFAIYNFDMDGEISIDYKDPNGVDMPGTVSENMSWNNGDLGFPPPGGDILDNPVPGWWESRVCIGDSNQYILYVPQAVFIHELPAHPRITLTKADTLQIVDVSQTYTYSLSIANEGDGPAIDVSVVDTLDAGLDYVTASGNAQITSDGSRTIVEWNLGMLYASQDTVLTLDVRVNDLTGTDIINQAFVRHTDVLFQNYRIPSEQDENIVRQLSSLGEHIWMDLDEDGAKSSQEQGIEHVVLQLFNSNGIVIDEQVSDAQGHYLFANLVPGNYTIEIDPTSLSDDLVLTTANLPYTVELGPGESHRTANFGFTNGEAYPIELSSFTLDVVDKGVLLKWQTQSETENLGFKIYRSERKDNDYEVITPRLISGALNSQALQAYEYVDETIEWNKTYFYILADVDVYGQETRHGPVQIETLAKTPQGYELEQNYPNPFNPETTIGFRLPEMAMVYLEIYNMRGQLVRQLLQRQVLAGEHKVVWDGRDDMGMAVPSGSYIYQLRTESFKTSKKMTLLK
ncbi:T9SS type A sorting domain-containing protein [candidate division KSB1 bacterium]|nr:T9SS type A sorting domain-containing protein [candidate division KSB1 bacterium]